MNGISILPGNGATPFTEILLVEGSQCMSAQLLVILALLRAELCMQISCLDDILYHILCLHVPQVVRVY